MTDFTPKKEKASNVIKYGSTHYMPSAKTELFLRLFARACKPANVAVVLTNG